MYISKTKKRKWKLDAANRTNKPNPCVICFLMIEVSSNGLSRVGVSHLLYLSMGTSSF
jgi:hypothetical protein